MESVHAQRLFGVSLLATWKEALNWFFKEGQKPSSAGVPPVKSNHDRGRDAHATAEVMTDVATRQRVSASTQKQALNALIAGDLPGRLSWGVPAPAVPPPSSPARIIRRPRFMNQLSRPRGRRGGC